MISRRSFAGCAAAGALLVPRVARSAPQGLTLSGSMEQGALVVGRAPAGSAVTVDGSSVSVSAEGLFAAGIAWDRKVPLDIVATGAAGEERTTVTPLIRHYDVQHVSGLPQKTVSPSGAELARIHAEHARLAEARKTDSGTTFFADGFDWPAAGIVSGVFGSYRIDNGVAMAPHMGVDIANKEGTPIAAPADGRIALTDDFFLEGGFTLIDHGHGVFTHYMHQRRRAVAAGDQVKRGDVIGAIGKTGRATGPHLHWGLNWFQVRLDPSRSTRMPAPRRA